MKATTNAAAEIVRKETTDCTHVSGIKKIKTARKLQIVIPVSSVQPASVPAKSPSVSNVSRMSIAKTLWPAQMAPAFTTGT